MPQAILSNHVSVDSLLLLNISYPQSNANELLNNLHQVSNITVIDWSIRSTETTPKLPLIDLRSMDVKTVTISRTFLRSLPAPFPFGQSTKITDKKILIDDRWIVIGEPKELFLVWVVVFWGLGTCWKFPNSEKNVLKTSHLNNIKIFVFIYYTKKCVMKKTVELSK